MDKNEDKKKNELEEVNLSKTQEILMKIIEKLDKKPDKVTPIWIVERNFVGLLTILYKFFAFLFPSLAIFSSLASFKETIAISLAAKNAFKKINTANKRT